MSKHHILVVDDEEGNRESLTLLLRAHDMHVLTCNSAKAALATLERDPAINLIISDVSMPEMDGVDFAERVHKSRPELPVILLTGHDFVVERVLKEGSMALLKPYEPARLLALIDELT